MTRMSASHKNQYRYHKVSQNQDSKENTNVYLVNLMTFFCSLGVHFNSCHY
jgi:hypothetical protein